MNSFMNQLYNASGAYVTGYFMGAAFIGRIVEPRAKAGTDISVKIEVDLEESDCDYHTLLVDGSTIFEGGDDVYKNLHVYF